MVIGQNGIFSRANKAKEETSYATAYEEIKMIILETQVKENGKATLENIVEKLKEDTRYEYIIRFSPVGKLSKTKGDIKEEGNIKQLIEGKKEIYVTHSSYEFKIDEKLNIESNKKNVEEQTPSVGKKVANEPDIKGFDKSKTYYVEWNLNTQKTQYIIDEKKMLENTPQENWYDYTAGQNKWANVKTTGGGNDCYFVWIPRYAYKVPTKGNTAQTIDIKFLQGTTNIPIGETIQITNKTPTPGTWVVHPAFTNEGNGGFGELEGIWVAKYEASSNHSSVVENPTSEQLKIDGGSETDTDLKVRVKPNVTSWRNITVGDIFTVCRNLTKAGNSLENTNNLNSHMMKNTEWGAVAYLSRSRYGKNSEVWNNPYYNDETNSSPITGLCGKGENDKDLSTTDINNTCKYNEVGGGNSSTTGNVYGVYDMVGGTWDYVAGILSNNKKNGNNTEKNNYYDFSNSNAHPNKYFDWYAGSSDDPDINYKENTNKYGDAVYETSNSGSSMTDSWESSQSIFPEPNYPVFVRGGSSRYSSDISVFAFNLGKGIAQQIYGFRPVVLSSQP